ncbi:MAG: universal stress protein [Bacteroidales bacterium]
MKQIIVPLDFSDESINGLELAVMISSKTKASIQMVYVQKKSSDFPQPSLEEEQRFAKSKFSELQAKYEHKLPKGVDLSYIVKRGKVYDEIVEQAESFEDSIIVVSTHGASGFEEFFIGSNTLKIITASERPVIAIKHGVIPRSFRKIVLPIDYSRDTRQKVPYTAKVAGYFGSEIHVMGVTTGNDQELLQRIKTWTHQVGDYLTENGIKSVVTMHRGESISDMTVDYVKNENIDLISIMTEQGTALSSFVIGNNAQQLISKSPVPIMCITPKDLQLRAGFKTYRGVPPA